MAPDDLNLKIRLTVDRDGRLQAVLSDTRGRLRNLGAEGERAGLRIDRGFGQARAGVESISRQLQAARRQIAAFFSIQYVSHFAGQTIRLADEYKTLQARLKLAAETQAEFNRAQAELFGVAQRSRSELSAVVDLYARIGPALKDATGSQREALAVTETILKAIQLSGSDAAASAAAIRQLAQALQAGALKGDEFVSVMEGAPALMRAIADGMGVPLGALKQLASEGKLTAKAIARALQTQRALVEAEFGKLPVTVGQALTRLENRWQRFLGELDSEAGFTDSLAAAIDGLSAYFDQAAGAAKALAGAHLASRMTQAAAATLRQRRATRALLVEERLAAQALARRARLELELARDGLRRARATARLTANIGALIAAENRLAAAQSRHAAASRAAAAATARLSRSAALAKDALALLGGPGGAALLAGYALYELAAAADAASRRTRDSIREMVRGAFEDLGRLSNYQIDLRLGNAKGVLESLDRDIDRARKKIASLRENMGAAELARGVFLGDNEYLREKRRLELLLARREEVESGIARMERLKASPARRTDFTGLSAGEIRAQAESLRAELARANRELERARRQFSAGVIPRGVLDQAQARVDALARRLKAAQKALSGLADSGKAAVKTQFDTAGHQAAALAGALAAIERETTRLSAQLAEQTQKQRDRLRRLFEAGLIDRQTWQQRAEDLARHHARQIAQIEALADRERRRAPELARQLAELEHRFRQKQIAAEDYARRRLELGRRLQTGLARIEVAGRVKRGQAFSGWLAERLRQEQEYHRRRIEALRQAQQLLGLSEAEFRRRMEEEARRHAGNMRRLRERGLDDYLGTGGERARGFAESLKKAFERAGNGAETLNELLANRLAQAAGTFGDTLTESLLSGQGAARSLQRQLAGLAVSLAKAIAKMVILKSFERALGGAGVAYGGGTGGMSLTGAQSAVTPAFQSGVYHTGGIAGEAGGATRTVPAWVFESAPRYHAGGIARDEVPAVLRKGEGVFTCEQMKALAPVDKVKPSVSVQVNLIESDRNQGTVSQRENADGGLTLDVVVARIRDQLVGEIERGGGMAPSMERMYGLKRRGY